MSDVNLMYRVEQLELHLQEQQSHIDAMEKEISRKEKQVLRSAMVALGLIVSSLFGIIWTYRRAIWGIDQ